MKRVIVAIQNVLVLEAIINALNKRGIFTEKSLCSDPQNIASLCKSMYADILVMDVTRFGEGEFINRMKTLKEVRSLNPNTKICFIFDNNSDNDLFYKILNAKETGQIDAFFYQSVPSDYVADVISTL